MPSDPASNSIPRRSSRKLAAEDEIDIRRARGEISCAECRRLKLKCDKKLPCSSCVRRGCQSICPNGSLSTGQGTRFVLADTEQLHRKIVQMGDRIRQLEDALAIFQAGVSNETHPLLRDELLSIKCGPEVRTRPDTIPQEFAAHAIDALGTLAIDDSGEKYYGRSAGSETLFIAGAELDPLSDDGDSSVVVTPEVARLANLFPFVPGVFLDHQNSFDILLPYLPPEPRAWALVETYFEHACWHFRPMQREELVDDFLVPLYKHVKQKEVTEENEALPMSPHKLAGLFMVFAIGSFLDLTLPPQNSEAEVFFQLARAALSLRSVFEAPEIATVQAVVLMAAYHSLSGKRYSMHSAWCLMSLGAKLAQSIGLHRDCARWNMPPKVVQRRRALFWEIFTSDVFFSLALGRPPSIRLSYIDCEFPEDIDDPITKDGETDQSFYAWKYAFTRDVFALVAELTLTAATPKYETVLELDRKVREKLVPSSLNIFKDYEYYSPSVFMQSSLISKFRSVALTYIHRSFFAQALLDYPVNPLRSPYAPSFLAAYRCASYVINSNISAFDRFQDLMVRVGNSWSHIFSAAIIVGSIVTRAPSSSMAPTAFVELGLAVDLFERGAQSSTRAKSGLAILTRLRAKALQVYPSFRNGAIPPKVDISLNPDSDNTDEDELAIFGGQARVLVTKSSSRRSTPKLSESPQSNQRRVSPRTSSPLTSAVTQSTWSDINQDMHPSLVEYLSVFPPPAYPQPGGGDMNNHFNEISSTPWFPDAVAFKTPLHTSTPPLPQADDLQNPSPFAISPDGGDIPEILMEEDQAHLSNFEDLGVIMPGESGIDEQWMSFVRGSGFMGDITTTPA